MPTSSPAKNLKKRPIENLQYSAAKSSESPPEATTPVLEVAMDTFDKPSHIPYDDVSCNVPDNDTATTENQKQDWTWIVFHNVPPGLNNSQIISALSNEYLNTLTPGPHSNVAHYCAEVAGAAL